jgi:hypothetical protein
MGGTDILNVYILALLDCQTKLPLLDLSQELAGAQDGFLISGNRIALQIVPVHELAPSGHLVKAIGSWGRGIRSLAPVLQRASGDSKDAPNLKKLLAAVGASCDVVETMPLSMARS